jgi:hypothetical protein
MVNRKSIHALIKTNVRKLLKKEKLTEKQINSLLVKVDNVINSLDEKELRQKGVHQKIFIGLGKGDKREREEKEEEESRKKQEIEIRSNLIFMKLKKMHL